MRRLADLFRSKHPADAKRGLLLFAYLFLVMASYMAARIARDAIFLGTFLAVDLAYVDLASALLIGIVVAGYLSIGRHVKLSSLLVGSLIFYAVNLVALWYIATSYDPKWLSPVIYVWVSLFGALAPVQVWTLANYVFTTREAKRMFGLVGSGAILGAVVGAKVSSLLARRFGAEDLLLGVALAMLASAALIPLIWRQRDAVASIKKDAVASPGHGAADEDVSRIRVVESLRVIGQSPYLRSIALLILVANITTSLAGWQFKALAKTFIPQKDALAAFFGDFYFYAGIAGFVVQMLVTGRLLRRFGLGPALLVVPVAFVFGSSGVLLWGAVTIWAAIALRSCINVLQYSVDKPSVELLYLPVPAGIKNQVKSFIDTVVWRFGDGLAAVAVLILGKGMGWAPARVSWIVLALLAAWMFAAMLARRLYVDTLRASIHDHRLDAERASAEVLDRSLMDLLANQMKSADPSDVVYALGLFDMGRRPAAHPAVRALLDHPAADVRARSLAILNEAGDTTVMPRVDAMLEDEDVDVRTEAMVYLARHADLDPLTRVEGLGEFADYSIRSAVAAYLARPGRAQNLDVARMMLLQLGRESGPEGKRARLEAARLLAHMPEPGDLLHGELLSDVDADVVREAARSINTQSPAPLLARLVGLLKRPEVAEDAAEVLARLGTADSARMLNDAVLEGDAALRFRVIAALNKLHQTHPDLPRDRQLIDTVLSAEILGHYRSYQMLGSFGPQPDDANAAVKNIRESIRREVERIFRLLALLYPNVDLHSAYYGVQSDNHRVHDNALEFLDNVLDKPMRRLLVPLLDSTVSVAERSRLAARLVGPDGKLSSGAQFENS